MRRSQTLRSVGARVGVLGSIMVIGIGMARASMTRLSHVASANSPLNNQYATATPDGSQGPTRLTDNPPATPYLAESTELANPRENRGPATGRIQVMVELSDPSLVAVYVQARANGAAQDEAWAVAYQQRASIETAQNILLEVLTAPPFEAILVGRTVYVANAVLIEIDASYLEQVRQLPGVLRVHILGVGELTTPAQPGAVTSPSGTGKPTIQSPGYPVEPSTYQ